MMMMMMMIVIILMIAQPEEVAEENLAPPTFNGEIFVKLLESPHLAKIGLLWVGAA